MAQPEQTGREQPLERRPQRATWRRVARKGALGASAVIGAALVAMLVAAAIGQRWLLAMPSLGMLALGLGGLIAIAAAAFALRRIERSGIDVDQGLERRPPLAARFVASTAMLALGASGIGFGGLMVALTASPRSILPLAIGVAFSLAALVLLSRASRSLRSAPTAALG
ncbi:hypothetical protein [Agrococcus lahaulensis]|uniref:hypothetical protein n=1 Tax=Agrococcus lahaulensis TaxID=341722 RepID=UPI00047E0FE8|nr:hypothetical protein [Agrococcus lahaulensis]